MNRYESSLDHTLLENMKNTSKGIAARCPACAEEGGDSAKRDHLLIYPNGAFNCAKYGKDLEHNRRIWELVGLNKGNALTTDKREEYKWRRRCEEHANRKRERLTDQARKFVSLLREQWKWEPCDVWEDSPQRIDSSLVEMDSRHFLGTLFMPRDIVWTGETWQSGEDHGRSRWRTVEDWTKAEISDLGPMISPATWMPSIFNRSATNVQSAPFTVLDFDELDGRKPETPDEKKALVHHALAVTRWLREEQGADLAAIVHSGNKSLHAWINTPDAEALQSLRDVSEALGIDRSLISSPEHPARLPGMLHEKSKKRSRTLWLAEPISPLT